ncbi:MAG TPA: hypothetical protein VNX40_10785 [Mucilaginibacter sp.]|jgi:hypothetical protein|nr:hypothetical protein [Mucilaginibacter sp.]
MQKFPELKNNQVALLRADALTGHVLDEQLKVVRNDEQHVYTVVNSYYEALGIAKAAMLKEMNIEYVIYGKNKEVLFTLSAEIRKAFDEDFCSHLEYHLCRTFYNSPDEEIYSLSCDGVDVPYENHLTTKRVIETKEIATMAWVGTDGQGRYEMIIKLGENSLNNFKKGLSLIECIPSEESLDWITINIEKRTIQLQLT